ncbi:MAG: histidine phosphatase family protein [Burkholderiaceae bacterium]
MNIILIRHGETPLNRARILQPADTPLSELGQQQAAAMAQRLSREPISAILSSDMTRAAQTASPLAAELNLPIEFSTVLHERNFGDLRGRRFSELGFDPMAADYEPPNGESWADFHKRVADAFDLVIAKAAGQAETLAVVSHGLVIREMIKRHLSSVPPPDHMANTSVTVFSRQPPYEVSLLTCDNHIVELMNNTAGVSGKGGLV